jgi:osmotically-inducible protein OsmY
MKTKTDMQLQRDVEEELRWDPKVNAARVGVTVDHGAVSLLGEVDTYAEKWAVEHAAKRVGGVRTVAQDLKVKLLGAHTRSDSEIAAAVEGALSWDVFVPKGVTARVQEGAVTLEGEVGWNYQRDAAERSIRHLAGVVMVANQIRLTSRTSAANVKEKVVAALARQATEDAKSIHVSISGTKATLTGHAASWQSIEDASNAAWAAPGITEVDDQLKLSASFESAHLRNEP